VVRDADGHIIELSVDRLEGGTSVKVATWMKHPVHSVKPLDTTSSSLQYAEEDGASERHPTEAMSTARRRRAEEDARRLFVGLGRRLL